MMEDRIVLKIENVGHGFGAHPVLHNVNIDIVRGEIVGIVGPSGCGKSTLFRAIIGTHPPLKGDVAVYSAARNGHGNGQRMVVRGPGRDRGIVYQQYSLFPFLTARENVAFGLMLDETSIPGRLFKYPKWRAMRKKHLEEAERLLEQMELGHAGHLYPSEMSGGMRQRVAVAQALIMKPEVIMLDEPFGALDEATREDLQRMLLSLYEENLEAKRKGQAPPYTILIVTHEIGEAIYVGDRVIGLSQYWDWKSEGFQECPGATVVYDHVAPVESPGAPRHYEKYDAQRAEIRARVFEPKVPASPKLGCIFWDEVAAGKGEGILQ